MNINGLINGQLFLERNFEDLQDQSILSNGQIYLYVVENFPQRYIKIGKTTNIAQRIQSLSGSNGGGNTITKVYLSPATWLESMEIALHDYYSKNRIKGTEWFKDLKFEEVMFYVDELFNTNGYKLCNKLRKEFYKNKE